MSKLNFLITIIIIEYPEVRASTIIQIYYILEVTYCKKKLRNVLLWKMLPLGIIKIKSYEIAEWCLKHHQTREKKRDLVVKVRWLNIHIIDRTSLDIRQKHIMWKESKLLRSYLQRLHWLSSAINCFFFLIGDGKISRLLSSYSFFFSKNTDIEWILILSKTS